MKYNACVWNTFVQSNVLDVLVAYLGIFHLALIKIVERFVAGYTEAGVSSITLI